LNAAKEVIHIRIYINIKSIGKRKPILEHISYTLPEGISNLRELITETVKNEIEHGGIQPREAGLFSFLTEEQIADKCTIGKIDFNNQPGERNEKPKKAIETALQGYEDGLFKVIIGSREAETLDTPITLIEDMVITYIKLTFLSGRY
jgi:hypothetical protein